MSLNLTYLFRQTNEKETTGGGFIFPLLSLITIFIPPSHTLKGDNNMKSYTVSQIISAVDCVIGDDGFRSKEVIEILKLDFKPYRPDAESVRTDILKLIQKQEELEQNIINIDAKYKFKVNEIMLMCEKEFIGLDTIDDLKPEEII